MNKFLVYFRLQSTFVYIGYEIATTTNPGGFGRSFTLDDNNNLSRK